MSVTPCPMKALPHCYPTIDVLLVGLLLKFSTPLEFDHRKHPMLHKIYYSASSQCTLIFQRHSHTPRSLNDRFRSVNSTFEVMWFLDLKIWKWPHQLDRQFRRDCSVESFLIWQHLWVRDHQMDKWCWPRHRPPRSCCLFFFLEHIESGWFAVYILWPSVSNVI